MAETSNMTYPYPSCFNSDNPWFVSAYSTDSLRNQTSFLSEQVRDTNAQILAEVGRTSAAELVAIEKIAAAQQISSEKLGAATQLAIEKTAAANQLFAAQNHATMMARMQECCCEIKEKIASDGQQTRDLINSIESDRLRTENANLTARLLALETSSHGNS